MRRSINHTDMHVSTRQLAWFAQSRARIASYCLQVAPPLASIRCGSAGKAGSFSPVLPSSSPHGVALRVPRGLAWHRDLVVWGTIGAAALGTLYTVYTLFAVLAADSVRNLSRKNRSKAHVE